MLAVLLLLQEPNLDQRVSLEEAAQSAPAFFSKLSERVGFEIAAPGTLRRNTLVIRFENTPLRTVLDRLADALSAKWQVVDKKRVEFYRPASLVKALRDKEDSDRKSAIQKALDAIELPELTEALAQKIAARARAFEPRVRTLGRDAEARLEQQAILDSMPAGRGAARIVKALPIERYMNMKVGERIVFASSPNQMQVALPNGRKLVDEFNAERGLMRQSMAEDLRRENEMVAYSDPRAGQFKLKSDAVKVVVGVTRSPEFRGFLANVRFVDADGWPVSTATTTVSDNVAVEPYKLDDVEVEIPESLYRLTEAIRSYGRISREERQRAVSIMTDPARNDPQGWYHGEMILDYSRKSKKPLAATLSDRGMRRLWLIGSAPSRRLRADALARMMALEWSLSSGEKQGAIVALPSTPLAAESEYLDRDLMSQAFGQMLKEKRLSILDAAEYAGKTKSALAGQFAEWSIAGWSSPSGFGSPDQELVSNWFSVVRFVGRVPGTYLAPGARPVTVAELPAEAKMALKSWVIDVPFTQMFGEKRDAEHPYDHIAYIEPTEAFPNGVPGSTQVRFTWANSPLILIGNDVGLPPTMYPYKFLAYMLDPAYGKSATYDCVFGRSLKIDLLLPDGRTASEEIWEAPPASTEPRNYRKISELPANVLELMRAEYAKQQAFLSTLGTIKPPPPAG